VINAHRLRQRARILRALRRWFDDHGYLEVHTPAIVPAGAMEPYLEPVQVGAGQLHTSPEFAMKRVLAAGLGRIYQIGPCFRDEEVGAHHSLEFTMLEWYRVGAGTPELIDEVEALVGAAAEAVDLEAPTFRRVTTSALLADDGDPDSWFHRWVSEVEPTLTMPTIVTEYPAWQAALARVRGDVADRFEVYLGGLELANAFAEEPASSELRERAAAADIVRRAAGRQPHPVDHAFLDAVDHMPRCAGIAMGIDRLVMALTGAQDIAEVQARHPEFGVRLPPPDSG